MKSLLATLSACALASTAVAQGADSCSAAQPIAGAGLFAFDNTLATTDGSPAGLCYAYGSSQIERDVWFAWTAPTSGYHTFATCNQTAIDTRLALYDGTCSGAVLACNDDACSLQSKLGYTVVAGNVYLVRVGVFPGTAGGPGNLEITALVPPQVLYSTVNPANNHTYQVLGYATWKECEARAAQLGGHLVSIEDQAENDWIQQNLIGAVPGANNLWIGCSDEQVEGTWAWTNGSTTSFLHWDLGQPDNYGNEDHAYMRPNGFWNDVPNGGGGANPRGLVEFNFSATPVAYCTAGTTSHGCAPTIGATGTPSATATSGFTISAANVDGQTQGLIFYGLSGRAALPWAAGSTSFFCVKAPIQRMPVQSSAGTYGACDGVLSDDWLAFVSANPGVLGTPLTVGAVIDAQGWFRDPPAVKTTNLTDALEFAVQP